MTKLTVIIDNKAQAKKLAGLLKLIKYIKEVRVEEPGIVLSDFTVFLFPISLH
mgnify:CR=1 FL=1